MSINCKCQLYSYKKLNDDPVEIEYVEDEHEESRDFQASFWWDNKRYFLDDFTRTHNNLWISDDGIPDYIHGFDSFNYHDPIFLELIGDSFVNIYREVPVEN